MRIARAGIAAVYAAALVFFYLKYVPLTVPFQNVFLPVLAGLTAAAWSDRRAGTLAFIALFPLVSGWPYFFGLYENVMHAPAALVLFLFYGLGRIGGWAAGKRREAAGGEDDLRKPDPAMGLGRPLILWAVIVSVSAFITAARYANFYPVLSPGIFEWTVNRAGGRAGGAIMSVVLSALNHLTGIAFFLGAAPLLGQERFRRRALAALGGGTLAALLFGLFQRLGHLALGNDRAGAALGLINGTFKDALSFGAFLSLVAPLFAAVFLTAKKGALKIIAAGVVILSLALIAFTGSKSGIIALAVALALFSAAAAARPRRRFVPAAAAVAALIVLGGTLVLIPGSGVGRRFAETGKYAFLRVKEMWAPAARMMRDYPLTGAGEGSYIIEASNYSDFFANRMADAESAENLFVQTGAETGLIGLAALLWIMGTIAVRAWNGSLEGLGSGKANTDVSPARKRSSLLAAGASLGLLAFFINTLAHTYIGSFEIKYAFWFLAALVFALTEKTDDESVALSGENDLRPRMNNRRSVWAAAALVFVFAAAQLWNSTHSLSIAGRTERFGFRQEFGLGLVEKAADGRAFRWSENAAAIPVRVDTATLILPLQAAHPDIVERPVRVRIDILSSTLGGRACLAVVDLRDHDWKAVSLDVSAWLGSEAVLLIRVDRTWSPEKMLGVRDARLLGVAVGVVH